MLYGKRSDFSTENVELNGIIVVSIYLDDA